MQPQRQTLSVSVAVVKVIDELKKVKRGLTIEDIQKRTDIVVNAGLLELLNKNQHLEFNEKTQRYVYKFKYNINCKQDIIDTLKEKGPLLVGDDVEGAYETIAEDIQELKQEHLVLSVLHQPKKKEVLYYYQPSQRLQDLLVCEISAAIKELWKSVPNIDGVELKKFLEKNRVKPAQLNTNVVPEEYRRITKNDQDKKQVKKKRRSSTKSNTSSELAALAQQITAVKGLFPDDTSSIKLGPIDDEVDDQKKQCLLTHNIEADPEEFEHVTDLIRLVSHWFYEEQHVVTLNEFLKQKYHKDTELAKILNLPQKQVGGILVKLHSHQLLAKRICEQGNRQFNVYDLDLDKFTNVCNYRLLKIQEILSDEIAELGSSIFQCEVCNKRYKALDLPTLYDSGTARHCNNGFCNAPLSGIDNSQKKEKEQLLEKVRKELQPLQDLLSKLTRSKETQPIGKPIFRRVSNTRKVVPRRSSTKPKTDTSTVTTDFFQKEKDYEIKLEPQIDFDPQPIFFSKKNEVFLPIAYTWEELKDNISIRLAKHFLDEISEFQKIVNARVYVYEITEHSLYLAWSRGYSAEEIIRLLKTLGRNPLPISTEKLIRDSVNTNKFYKATMAYRNKHYCVQADYREVLEKLLQKYSIKELVPDSTQLQEVTTGTKKVTYHFPIKPGCSERVKEECLKVGVALIDEFDFANAPTLPSININMRPSTKVRFYQEFAVSRLFWNGYKCHSGILVLPCGAGKTLIGINVTAALKKPSIIYCQSILAVNQWKEQLVKWTTIQDSSVSRFSSIHHLEWNPGADILITTYGMFSTTSNRSEEAQKMMKIIKEREWGLMILDEVHLVPAKIFRKVTNQIRSHIKLGLTATMVRQDDLIKDLPNLVGPKLFELDIFTLRMHNYISPVQCIELHTPMTEIFSRAYAATKSLEEERLLYSTNPNKTRVVYALIKSHIDRKHRIMVFCDNLFCLQFYTEILKRPKIDGSTKQEERADILRKFRESSEGGCVLFSQVGDQSIDLPEADVVIQVALMHGGRMQEGQRIGRIQRPQPGKTMAYFYSLVSDKTKESEFAKSRRHFLQDQGYTIKREKDREYEKYLSEDTLHVIGETLQRGIIDTIQNELYKRDHEKQYGKPKAEPGQSSTKRKRTNDSQKQIKKKLKNK